MKKMFKLSLSIFLCALLLLSQSCREKSLDNSSVQPQGTSTNLRVAKQKMDESISYVASSKHLKILLDEATNIEKLQRKKKIKIYRISEDELKNRLNNCKEEKDFDNITSSISSDPDAIKLSVKNIFLALQNLDSEIHFSQFSNDDKKELFVKVFEKYKKENSGKSVIVSGDVSLQFLDCGGDCNNTYGRNMDNAAQNLIVATAVAWAGGAFGGPAGMMAGSVTIVGAVAWYYIVADLYLQQLGDCFNASGCAVAY